MRWIKGTDVTGWMMVDRRSEGQRPSAARRCENLFKTVLTHCHDESHTEAAASAKSVDHQ